MKRRSSKQPPDKKPIAANSELWRKIPEGLQEKVQGGQSLIPTGLIISTGIEDRGEY